MRIISKTQSAGLGHESAFPQTCWSLVVRSSKPCESGKQQALSDLCQLYWRPLFQYLRRSGWTEPDAEDLVQDFFSHILKNDVFGRARPEQGKLRSFLLKSLKNYAVDRHRYRSAEKRGGGSSPVSIDHELAEHQQALEQDLHLSPDLEFDRQWAYSVLGVALEKVERHYRGIGKAQLFEQLSPLLSWNARSRPQREVARDLELTESVMRVALHRLRARFRAAIRDQVAQTVRGGDLEVEEELQTLFRALA